MYTTPKSVPISLCNYLNINRYEKLTRQQVYKLLLTKIEVFRSSENIYVYNPDDRLRNLLLMKPKEKLTILTLSTFFSRIRK